MRQFFGAAVVTTSFEAELLAALEGLQRVPDGAHVTLYTDCAQIREGFGALQARAEAASVLKVKPLRSRERRKANPTLLAATRERMAALWKAVWKELKRLAGVKVRNAKARPEGLGVAHQLSRRGSAQCETLLRRGALSQPACPRCLGLRPSPRNERCAVYQQLQFISDLELYQAPRIRPGSLYPVSFPQSLKTQAT